MISASYGRAGACRFSVLGLRSRDELFPAQIGVGSCFLRAFVLISGGGAVLQG